MSVVTPQTYPAILWKEKHLAYIPIPKVASTSVKKVLQVALGLPPAKPWRVHGIQWPHTCPIGEIPSNYKVFTVIRSPWARLQSCWKSKIADYHKFPSIGSHGGKLWAGMPFVEFCRSVATIPDEQADEHLCSQTTIIGNRCHLLLRLEALRDSWWPLWTGYQLPCPPQENNLRNQLQKETLYNEETRDLVLQRYAADVTTFGYIWSP